MPPSGPSRRRKRASSRGRAKGTYRPPAPPPRAGEVGEGGTPGGAEQQLAGGGQEAIDHQVAERMPGRPRVDAAALALDAQPELEALRGLTESDRVALGLREALDGDVRQHVER